MNLENSHYLMPTPTTKLEQPRQYTVDIKTDIYTKGTAQPKNRLLYTVKWLFTKVLHWSEQRGPETHGHPEPQNVTLFGRRVFADVIS